jgi:hypothetical protein
MHRICPLIKERCIGKRCVAFESHTSVYEAFSITKGSKMVEKEEFFCMALNVELRESQEEALKRSRDAME